MEDSYPFIFRTHTFRYEFKHAHLPPAVRKVLAHIHLLTLGNLRGGKTKRRVRVSGENTSARERHREEYNRGCDLFHGGEL